MEVSICHFYVTVSHANQYKKLFYYCSLIYSFQYLTLFKFSFEKFFERTKEIKKGVTSTYQIHLSSNYCFEKIFLSLLFSVYCFSVYCSKTLNPTLVFLPLVSLSLSLFCSHLCSLSISSSLSLPKVLGNKLKFSGNRNHY